ncbi:organic solute transporter ostalpha protein [Actinidia rufa]|uniref:Organic solute transporter ostalpha protein n=1 Tax=Actinidia rufa TaxID=165716 RepID=A0A7J0F815_9ERIC|nr:organic solute transporter ostalpha protein [Actinidia rufa]
MLIAAVGHLYAFPYKEYVGANIGGSCGFTGSLTHAVKLNDFYHDTVHQFAPTYHDYVLYNHGDGDEGPRKYRSRTFVLTGPEMDTVGKNKHMFGNKLDVAQLSCSSGSRTPHTDQNSTPQAKNVPYDLSLIDIDMSNSSSKVPGVSYT